ncbi:hypothetical protein BP6252_04065 [Coleophoma cylindrospora]|uniref:CCHC-type domain-containing protein n=1 Tax=Coleophoma cylindrospora TaxID=1849047 RepID=A0A3D8RZD6_9HELO|nr:hypothetical protein BP6252_04065 [Coleophoma cylindrospora]
MEALMRAHINHVQKPDFLHGFYTAFFKAMTKKNIQGGFIGAGLIPHDPERVLSKLDIHLRTPTPPITPQASTESWVSRTPQNPIEVDSQTGLIKSRISNHQNSSPTPMLDAVDQFSKGAKAMMHEVALLRAEVSTLRRANEALSKRRRAKRTRLQHGGTLTVGEAQSMMAQADVDAQLKQEVHQSRRNRSGAPAKARCCRTCGKTGHNARTCQEASEAIALPIPDTIVIE